MAVEKAKNVPPFVLWCSATIPTAFDDSMSYYEALCALYKFIQDNMVEPINHNADVLEQTVKDMQALKEYVDNYFDNLDVQEEINNKLDEMAEGGQLATIISEFVNLGALFTYDTVADMKAATNLVAGCTCQTLGKETLNDGFGAYYKIDSTGDILLDNGLYASVVNDFGGNNYYNEISVVQERAFDTDYYVATIPLNDADGNLIDCYINEDETKTITPLQYAGNEHTTLTMNAGLGRQNSNDQWKQGAIISNGEILHEDLCDVPAPEYLGYVGIKADRSLVNYPANTTAQTMLNDGVKNAYLTFGQVVSSGAVSLDEHWVNSNVNPLAFIGSKADGTIIIMECDGRTSHDKGLTVAQGAGIMVTKGCVNAWLSDGGGSNSLVYKGSKQNRNIDENGTKDRGIWVTLNFKKDTIDKELAKVDSFIGAERQLLNKQIRDDMKANSGAFVSLDSQFTGYNVVTTDNTAVGISFNHSFTHNNNQSNALNGKVIEFVYGDESHPERVTAFKLNREGLYEIKVDCCDYCKSTAGMRTISLDAHNVGEIATGYCVFYNYITPTANNQTHQINATFVYNCNAAGTTYYISGTGPLGDDFNRVYVTIREIGSVND